MPHRALWSLTTPAPLMDEYQLKGSLNRCRFMVQRTLNVCREEPARRLSWLLRERRARSSRRVNEASDRRGTYATDVALPRGIGESHGGVVVREFGWGIQGVRTDDSIIVASCGRGPRHADTPCVSEGVRPPLCVGGCMRCGGRAATAYVQQILREVACSNEGAHREPSRSAEQLLREVIRGYEGAMRGRQAVMPSDWHGHDRHSLPECDH